ncbi:MAG: hypothetical protein ABI874_11055 [Chloroflexota bacterium]
MNLPTHERSDVDRALTQCLLVASRRGAQIRAALRAQHGRERGDAIVSELAREAERKLFERTNNTPDAAILADYAAGVAAVSTSSLQSGEHDASKS